MGCIGKGTDNLRKVACARLTSRQLVHTQSLILILHIKKRKEEKKGKEEKKERNGTQRRNQISLESKGNGDLKFKGKVWYFIGAQSFLQL